MGRKLNVSQAAVIQTELTPLDDALHIEASDTLEQWYYVNTDRFSPNRSTTPLVLTPKLEAYDTETQGTYRPAFGLWGWYYHDNAASQDSYPSDDLWPGRCWVPVTQTNRASGADFIKYVAQPNTDEVETYQLIVRKNVPAASSSGGGLMLCFVGQYTDPRDNGVTYMVKQTVTLTTNQDATTEFFDVDIQTPVLQTFNPLVRWNSSLYTFKAVLTNKAGADVTDDYTLRWYGRIGSSGAEVLLETLPCYTEATQPTGKGQGTDTVAIDVKYAEKVAIVCRVLSSGTLLPPRDEVAVSWGYPSIRPITHSRNGQNVNNVNRKMTFEMIVNTRDGELDAATKREHFRYNWKKHVSTSTATSNLGWGETLTVDSSSLKQTTSHVTEVNADVYILGPLEAVTDNSEAVTDDGSVVYDRA